MGFLLHIIFQRQGIPPHEIMDLPRGRRAFLFASTIIWLEEEEELRRQMESG